MVILQFLETQFWKRIILGLLSKEHTLCLVIQFWRECILILYILIWNGHCLILPTRTFLKIYWPADVLYSWNIERVIIACMDKESYENCIQYHFKKRFFFVNLASLRENWCRDLTYFPYPSCTVNGLYVYLSCKSVNQKKNQYGILSNCSPMKLLHYNTTFSSLCCQDYKFTYWTYLYILAIWTL